MKEWCSYCNEETQCVLKTGPEAFVVGPESRVVTIYTQKAICCDCGNDLPTASDDDTLKRAFVAAGWNHETREYDF